MSTGSVRSPPPPAAASGTIRSATCYPFTVILVSVPRPGAVRPGASDVEEPDVLGIALDERAARLDVLAHQHGEQLVGLGRVVHRDLAEHPAGRVHRGLPQLDGIHLAQALEPLDPAG